MTNSANVYKGRFMHTRIVVSADEKYSRLVSPRGRKFGVIDTPQNFEVQPPISPKQIERPPNFFQLLHTPSKHLAGCKELRTFDEPISKNWGSKKFPKGGRSPKLGEVALWFWHHQIPFLNVFWHVKNLGGGPQKWGKMPPWNVLTPKMLTHRLELPNFLKPFFIKLASVSIGEIKLGGQSNSFWDTEK